MMFNGPDRQEIFDIGSLLVYSLSFIFGGFFSMKQSRITVTLFPEAEN